jgi:GalNAc-alpha-(1->4)-GalNAc-alpha-(1->3)-diNAcBac-PP-undecaprenol alpha-1,4-N-acetyl-D-galactosaminyltransferase
MRVALLIDNLGSGGAQRQMVNLAVGLVSRGHVVTLLRYALGDHFSARLDGTPILVRRVAKAWRFDPSVVARIRCELQAAAPDVVVSFLLTPNTYSLLAGAWLGCRWKTVVSERSFDPPGRMSFWSFALRQLYRRADAVVFNSHHQLRSVERTLPWVARRASTIYNGVDLDEFRPAVRRPFAGAIRLLAVGRDEPDKNGLLLVAALALLRHSLGLDARVQWVGDAKAKGEGHHSRMMKAIGAAGVEAAWEWVPPQADLRDYLGLADALVHPSLREGLPNVVCEALASGVPVLASNCLDHPRLVIPGQTGFLFDPNDPQDLAKAVQAFIELPREGRTQMGHAARSFAERNLSLSRMVDAYESLFAQLGLSMRGTE